MVLHSLLLQDLLVLNYLLVWELLGLYFGLGMEVEAINCELGS